MKLDDALRDLLLERGADEYMLRWLEHPEAVRAILYRPQPGRYALDQCGGCISPGWPHRVDCKVGHAFDLLHFGDPEADQDNGKVPSK